MSYIVRLDEDTWLAPSNSEPAKSTMLRRSASRWADKLSAIAASRQRLREFGHVPREPDGANVQVLFSIWLTAELGRVAVELSKVERKAAGVVQ